MARARCRPTCLKSLTGPVSLQDLVAYPLITYEMGYTGRAHIDEAFAAAGLACDVVLTAMDADVIKTYVELEMGVGIVASIAVDPERDRQLRIIDAGHFVPGQCDAPGHCQKALAAQVRLCVHRDVCAYPEPGGGGAGVGGLIAAQHISLAPGLLFFADRRLVNGPRQNYGHPGDARFEAASSTVGQLACGLLMASSISESCYH